MVISTPSEGDLLKTFLMTGCKRIRGPDLGIGFVEARGESIPIQGLDRISGFSLYFCLEHS
jgi:hypothetical protein